jgi:hypothetical protein
MTAEVAILNRQAVALAADSAVTINYPGGPKVFNSVSKVFTLSKYAPVGVMVYGVAELTGVPWETIIKTFRQELGVQRFGEVRDYAAKLIDYINNHKLMFSEQQQQQQFMSSVLRQFRSILRPIDIAIKEELASKGDIKHERIRRIAYDTIRRHHEKWMNAEPLQDVPSAHASTLRRKWRKEIDGLKEFVFGKIPLGRTSSRRLTEIAGKVFSVKLFPDAISGIVVAGFGEDEYFPRLVAYDVEGVLLNFMKIREMEERSSEVGGGTGAVIVPFAQREMVDLFMTGIDPVLQREISKAFSEFLRGLPDVLVDATGATGRAADQLRRETRKGSTALTNRFFEQLGGHIDERHIQPIVTAVESLPKEELAAMAESLVSLTSFKRRVTQDPETVGGPIDVAVISKGDGFVWIHRKHYFDPALNHQFFATYFREGGTGHA